MDDHLCCYFTDYYGNPQGHVEVSVPDHGTQEEAAETLRTGCRTLNFGATISKLTGFFPRQEVDLYRVDPSDFTLSIIA